MKFKAVLLSLLLLFSFLFVSVNTISALDSDTSNVEVKDYKANLDKTKNDLNSIRAAIKLERENIEKEKYREKSTTKSIQKIEKKLDITRKELNVFKNNIGMLETNISNLNKRIKDAENQKELRKKVVMETLRRQYEQQDKTYIKFLFRSGGIADFIKNYKFVKILSRKNADVVEEYIIILQKLDSDKAAILDYKGELNVVKKDKEDQWKQFKNESAQKKTLLKNIQSNIKERSDMVKELELSARKLNKLIDDMPVVKEILNKEAAVAFIQNKGKFAWPVEAGYILAKFGKYKHPQFKSIVENRGLHISERYGAPVFSVFSGVVRYADWFEGYGKMIVILHAEGYYSIYAHLSELNTTVGSKVGIRQVIGKVGDTESFFGNELYFELRNKGVPVDPLRYLKRR
ncbi:MAG: peptidoglycan DD-metalloendopeptidase family protein [bacterium]